MLNLNITLHPYNSKRGAYNIQQELRLGIAHYRGRNASFYFNKEIIYTVDSSRGFFVNYEEIIDEIAVEGSYLFKANAYKRVGFYIGIGSGTGFSIYSTLTEYTGASTTFNVTIGNTRYELNTDGSSNFRYIKAKSHFYLRAYIPVGINVRIIKRIDIMLEARSGLSYQQTIKGDGTLRNHIGLGLNIKYRWQPFAPLIPKLHLIPPSVRSSQD